PISPNVTSLPLPNQKDTKTRVSLVIGVEVSTTSVMAVFVFARFYMRTFVKRVLGTDDWAMGAAAVCFFITNARSIINCVETRHALGLHIWNISLKDLALAAKVRAIGYISVLLFMTCTTLTKISMCLTYLRILYARSDRIFCYCAMIFVLASWICISIIIIFLVAHLSSPWDLANVPLNQEAAILSSATMNSISDFLVFLWPLRTLWTVKLPTRQRFGLVFVFSVGCIVCVAGICRMAYLIRFFKSPDVFYDGAVIYVICAIEANVGVICGCLPALKPLLARYFHCIFGNT
ncbi:hypothetical protein K432DRAFT_282427, partial [Lepidopterella palustris CBS 459.81]